LDLELWRMRRMHHHRLIRLSCLTSLARDNRNSTVCGLTFVLHCGHIGLYSQRHSYVLHQSIDICPSSTRDRVIYRRPSAKSRLPNCSTVICQVPLRLAWTRDAYKVVHARLP
jgi:hypothetical protein